MATILAEERKNGRICELGRLNNDTKGLGMTLANIQKQPE